MGALPSRETQERGLYSHRHGRNRRNEIILIPLTKQFFPSADCPLFRHVFQSRRRRTAKYYYRPVRSAECKEESDYFCVGSEVNDGEQYKQFSSERLARLTDAQGQQTIETDVDYLYDGFSDTPEGLYNFLVEDNEKCLFDTDEALRKAYYSQLRDQRERMGLQAADQLEEELLQQHPNPLQAVESVSFESFLQGYKAAKQYYLAKDQHTVFRESTLYQTEETPSSSSPREDYGVRSSPILTAKDTEKEKAKRIDYLHRTTSPAAYYLRPIPCVIASRVDPNKSTQPTEDPLYVQFDGSYVKVMGMFGLQPSTLTFATEASHDNTDEAVSNVQKRKNHINAPYEAEHSTIERVEQHLLKGVMFVDRDVGDQILGNMVLLAAHMYTRQCLEANIQSAYIPFLPFYMRFPLSNIPMLQFVKEFRVRLRVLLEAGTVKSGFKNATMGLTNLLWTEGGEGGGGAAAGASSSSPTAASSGGGKGNNNNSSNKNNGKNSGGGNNNNSKGAAAAPSVESLYEHNRQREEFFLFEEDVPYLRSYDDLLLPPEEHAQLRKVPPGVNTSAKEGHYTIYMASGMSVPTSRTAGPLLSELVQAGDHRYRKHLTTPQLLNSSKASGAALLQRRKSRFRLWVEDGQLCLWASASFARRACLLLAQQLNSAVDAMFIPDHRTWIYRGLVHPGKAPPPPESVHDVLVVAADCPGSGLWQGDVLRCCTPAEAEAKEQGTPLPLPIVVGKKKKDATTASPPAETNAVPLTSLVPRNAFWVRAAGGLDDSFTNFSEPNAPLSPKAEKQLKELQQQLHTEEAGGGGGGERPLMPPSAASTTLSTKKHPTLDPNAFADSVQSYLASLFVTPDRREGTLNLEDVLLSWMKAINIATRNAEESDPCWVRRPDGTPLRVDRYLIRRLEHDGVRYFIGVTPRFAGQQRRIERVLGQVLSMAEEGATVTGTEGSGEREAAQRRLLGPSLGEDGDPHHDGRNPSHDDDDDDHPVNRDTYNALLYNFSSSEDEPVEEKK